MTLTEARRLRPGAALILTAPTGIPLSRDGGTRQSHPAWRYVRAPFLFPVGLPFIVGGHRSRTEGFLTPGPDAGWGTHPGGGVHPPRDPPPRPARARLAAGAAGAGGVRVRAASRRAGGEAVRRPRVPGGRPETWKDGMKLVVTEACEARARDTELEMTDVELPAGTVLVVSGRQKARGPRPRVLPARLGVTGATVLVVVPGRPELRAVWAPLSRVARVLP